MDKVKDYFRKLAKQKADSNYWLQFDIQLKEVEGEISEVLDALYPEIPCAEISTIKANKKEIISTIGGHISYPKERDLSADDQAKHLLAVIHQALGSENCVYYSLNTNEDYHPSPCVFWQFWYIAVSSNNMCVGFSGSGCD